MSFIASVRSKMATSLAGPPKTEELEYASEQDMKWVSLTPQRVLPNLAGANSHWQLRDLFCFSSIDPNYVYTYGVPKSTYGARLLCVNLQTGEYRSLGKHLGCERIHCISAGYGFLAVITHNTIALVKESNWKKVWKYQAYSGHHLNSIVITKLLADDEGTPERIVAIVGSNGGAVYTFAIPEEDSDEPEVPFTPSIPKTDPSFDRLRENDNDHEIDPASVVSLLPPSLTPSTASSKMKLLQILSTTGSEPDRELPNINCLAQGPGMYTDYFIGAADYETRLLVFSRQYGNHPAKPYWEQSTRGESKDMISVFELIEQQRSKSSYLMPMIELHKNENDSDDDKLFGDGSLAGKNSLNLAWAPWLHRSLVAAGTDSNDLFVFDFDAVQNLLASHPPDHCFDFEQSSKTKLYHMKTTNPVRLLKFSPFPSIPLLAFADMSNKLRFLNCRDWSIETVTIEGSVTGMAWSSDVSFLWLATTSGYYKIRVKQLPSLTDTLLLKVACSPEKIAQMEAAVHDDEFMLDRFRLLTAGRVFGSQVSWLDEEYLVPPPKLKSGPGPSDPMLSNIGPIGLGLPRLNDPNESSSSSDHDSEEDYYSD